MRANRPVADTCTRCANFGANLTANACPANMYKTNVRCAADSRSDSTCGPCKQSCRAGTNGSDPGQYIARACDGTGTSPEVQCAECTRMCAGVSCFTLCVSLCVCADVRGGKHVFVCFNVVCLTNHAYATRQPTPPPAARCPTRSRRRGTAAP